MTWIYTPSTLEEELKKSITESTLKLGEVYVALEKPVLFTPLVKPLDADQLFIFKLKSALGIQQGIPLTPEQNDILQEHLFANFGKTPGYASRCTLNVLGYARPIGIDQQGKAISEITSPLTLEDKKVLEEKIRAAGCVGEIVYQENSS